MDKLDRQQDGRTVDILEQNIANLKVIFPDVFTEGKVDFEVLREKLGDYITDGEARYSFTWNGKSRARRIAQTPSTGTLRPCREESVNWDTSQNLFIEGDNLEVLKLLQKSYHKRVKMIFIDPPYNTGKDFIYPDDFRDNVTNYLELTGQSDDGGRKLSANAETAGRYHTNWLNMMYPRLTLARNLLRDDGVIFISIDDTEMANLRKLCDEVFGEESFVANIIWQKKYAKQNDSRGFSISHDHILLYCRSIGEWTPTELPRTEEQLNNYKNPDNDPRGAWQSVVYTCSKTSDERPNLYYPITHPKTGAQVWPSKSRVWSCEEAQHKKNVAEGRIWWGLDQDMPKPRLKSFLAEVKGGIVPDTIWFREDVGDTQESKRRIMELFDGAPIFDTPKPTRLIKRMMQVALRGDEAIVLDFFGGSSSTADAVLDANRADGGHRRFIMVQLPEAIDNAQFTTIAEIGKERIRRVIKQMKNDDLGFKVFKLDSSNIKPWDADVDNLEPSLLAALDSIKPGRSQADVLYEILLKYGLDLAIPVEERNIQGNSVYIIGAGALVVCLADDISLNVVSGIAALKEELTPAVMRVVFKDASFRDDVVKTNAVQMLRQAGVDDVKSL